MNETDIDKAEQLLSYYDQHGADLFPESAPPRGGPRRPSPSCATCSPSGPRCEAPASACMVPSDNHSDDVIEVWHGMSTPAISCGFHATYYAAELFAAHRESVQS